MAVLTQDVSAETIKALLVAGDSKFFLVRSKNPHNTYRVLWYNLSSTPSGSSSYASSYASYHSRKCKVDILSPGTLNVPLTNQILQQTPRGAYTRRPISQTSRLDRSLCIHQV